MTWRTRASAQRRLTYAHPRGERADSRADASVMPSAFSVNLNATVAERAAILIQAQSLAAATLSRTA